MPEELQIKDVRATKEFGLALGDEQHVGAKGQVARLGLIQALDRAVHADGALLDQLAVRL